jgi:hypothetical protein
VVKQNNDFPEMIYWQGAITVCPFPRAILKKGPSEEEERLDSLDRGIIHVPGYLLITS